MTDDVIQKATRDKTKRVWVDTKNKKAFILEGVRLTELIEKKGGKES